MTVRTGHAQKYKLVYTCLSVVRFDSTYQSGYVWLHVPVEHRISLSWSSLCFCCSVSKTHQRKEWSSETMRVVLIWGETTAATYLNNWTADTCLKYIWVLWQPSTCKELFPDTFSDLRCWTLLALLDTDRQWEILRKNGQLTPSKESSFLDKRVFFRTLSWLGVALF
jgi:hypothetical protein